ncbi:MAG: septum formation initiator family protein [bacterium]
MAKGRVQKGLDRRLLRGRPRKKRNFWLFVGSLFFLWMAYLFVGGDYGLLKVISLKRQEIELRSKLLGVRARKEVLLKETKRLKNDLGTIEKIAREELGMIGEGEIRYQFPDHFGEQLRKRPETP